MIATDTLRSCLSLPQPALRVADSWRHQVEAYNFAMPQPASMLAMEMGTGKTKVVVDLHANTLPPVSVICCPCSVRGVWRREFKKWSAADVEVLILDKGSTKQKTELVDRYVKLSAIRKTPLVIVVNYESAWLAPLGDYLLSLRPALWVCDESHRSKGAGTKISRYLQRAGIVSGRRLCLTGTPMPHSPLDVYGQYRFLNPTIFGTNYYAFRSRYAICDQQFPSKVNRWINQSDLYEKFYSIAYRCRADEVLDLPSVMHETRHCVMTPTARRLYEDLKDELIAECGGRIVETPNALVKLLRLQQIAAGYVPTVDPADETTSMTHLGDWKQASLVDLLEDMPTDEPVVVFCRFRADLNAVRQAAEQTGRRYGELSGRRKDLTPDATMPSDVDLLGVQISSGGVGIDLTRAAYGVYYSQTWNLGEYDQSVARLHRPGQLRPVRFYHLLAVNTVDVTMRYALNAKRNVVEAVLSGLVNGETNDGE